MGWRYSPAAKGFEVVGIAWIVVGIVMVLVATPRLAMGIDSLRWLPTTGHITESDIISIRKSSGDVSFYKVEIAYAYAPPPPAPETYNRNNRLSTQGFIDPEDNSYSLAQARHLTQEYPVGKEVTVYYNPYSLTQSVLQTGISAGSFGGTVFGAVTILLGILLLRAVAKQRHFASQVIC